MARPLKYKTVDELQRAIDDYFLDCKGRVLRNDDGTPMLDRHGAPVIVDEHPPTVTGLALALGFSSRQALLNYQGKKQFHDTITRAKSRCEAYAESRLFDRDGARGAQFSLEHNFKWGTSDAPQGADVAADDPLTRSLRELAGEMDRP